MSKEGERWALLLILALYLVIGVAYSLVNPILESPDELLNYENIRFIVEEKRLPILHPGEFSKAHHPPLYYIAGAVLTGWVANDNLAALAGRTNPYFGYHTYTPGIDNKSQYIHDPALEAWPYQDAVLGIHLLRWVSILMGAGAVFAVYQTARLLFAQEPFLALGTAVLVAFNPMFLFIQSSVHNDALTNLLAALTIWGVVRYWQLGPSARRAAFIGATAALGILTKITFLFLGPVVLVSIVARHGLDRHTRPDWWRQALRQLAIGGTLVILIAGWWFVRNQLVYGEPTSMRLQASIWQPRDNAPDWLAAFGELDYLRDSFWGVFGFGQITMGNGVYRPLWALVLVAAAGLVLWTIRNRRAPDTYRVPALLLVVLLVAPLIAFAAVFGRMAVSATANFGRYLFTAYGVIAPLLILGLTEWIPFAWRVKSVGVLALSFLALSLYGVAGVLAPAYAPPPIYTSLDDITISHPTMIDYPGLARLVGYDLNPESAVPGQSIAVTLYWQVTDDIDEDYSLFVNLVNAEGTRVGGRDTLAGLGRYSTSLWQPGQIIADTIPLPLTTATSGPTGLRLDIGWRGSDGKRLLTADGEATATIGLVRLAAAEPVTAVGNPITYHFGDMIDLVAMTPLPDVVSPGDTLQLTMTWQTRQTPDRDYTVFIHLLDQSGELVTQFDRPPSDGAFPTHLWQPGDVVVDTRQLPLPADLGGGTYRALVGWYRLEDLTRLPARNGAGEPVPGNAIPLFTLTVEQP